MKTVPKVYYIPNDLKLEPVALLWPNLRFEMSASLHYLRPAIMQYEEPIVKVVSTPEAADFLVLPYDYFGVFEKHKDYVDRMITLAQSTKKKLLIFDGSDYSDREIDVPSDVCVVFRVGLYRHHKRENEIAMPYYVLDFGRAYGVSLLPKTALCGVSFCAWAVSGTLQKTKIFIKTFVQQLSLFCRGDRLPRSHEKGLLWRARVARVLARSHKVRFDAILRAWYSGHKKTVGMDPTRARMENVENLRRNHYALAVRGDANTSQRFYEALSFASPVLLLDTDCVLPLEACIPYDKILCRVSYAAVREAGERLAHVYEQMSDKEVVETQELARKIFLEYLTPPAFFALVFDRVHSPYKALLYGE